MCCPQIFPEGIELEKVFPRKQWIHDAYAVSPLGWMKTTVAHVPLMCSRASNKMVLDQIFL